MQMMIYEAREGDYTLSVVQTGFTDDADAMLVGWIYTTKQGDTVSNANGIAWDTSRILVDCTQPLTVREVETLRSAGFTVDDTFLP